MKWVFANGNPSPREMSDCPDDMFADIKRITMGEKGNVNEIPFRDPSCFRAGEIHHHMPAWERILENNLSKNQIMPWLEHGVDVKAFVRPFKGVFKGVKYDSPFPPERFSKTTLPAVDLLISSRKLCWIAYRRVPFGCGEK